MCHQWPRICYVCRNHNPVLTSFMTYHRVYSKSYATGATCEVDTNLLSFWSTWVESQFYRGSCCSIFSFLCSALQISVCPFFLFSFCHCVVCPSIYGFWLPLWILQTFAFCNDPLKKRPHRKRHVWSSSMGCVVWKISIYRRVWNVFWVNLEWYWSKLILNWCLFLTISHFILKFEIFCHLVIALSALLRLITSDYPFGIFKLFLNILVVA